MSLDDSSDDSSPEPVAERVAAAVARQRAYVLLAALLVEGIDAERLAVVRALPVLAERLPEPDVEPDLEPDVETVELEALAAEHYALFGHELFPFEGVFTSEQGLVGAGAAPGVLRAAHAALGLRPDEDPSLDHLGQGLRLLATLVDAELEARAHGDAVDARTLVRWQRRVLDEALLPWMAPLLVVLPGQPASLWTGVVELAAGVLARHRAELPGLPQVTGAASFGVGSGAAAATGAVEAVLDDPRTGLRTVAELLATPARSGVFLARRDLEAVARRCELPHGFGARRDVLERLLRVAAEYRELPRVLDELLRVLDARDEAYAGLEREPGLSPHVPAWRRRVMGTRRMLERLREAALQVDDRASRPRAGVYGA